ncbi:hypothetical protein K438DRAFT_1864083 [Mycena galopus ATCC 62051]|nr:hypothetical protein K438DRAFT_1864083 [Mycena galopus ATCC 62051]
MTEYDYSPEAVSRYNRKLQEISQWSESTAQIPQKNPTSRPRRAATGPLVDEEEEEELERARSRDREERKERARSSTRTIRSRDRDQDRERERDRRTTPSRSGPPCPTATYAVCTADAGDAGDADAAAATQQTQTQTQRSHSRSRSTSYHAPPHPNTTGRGATASPPQQAPPHVQNQIPQPLRANSYPHPAGTAGQKGYVFHPFPSAPSPQPSPQYYPSAPNGPQAQPQMHPNLFNQHIHAELRTTTPAPTKDVPLLKRVFGFGMGKRDRSRSVNTREY